MGTKPRPRPAAKADPAVATTARLLHHRRGWIWLLAASAVGFGAALAASFTLAAGGTAYVIVSVVEVVMLIVFVVAGTFIIVDTSRLRRHPAQVRGPAQAAHRSAGHQVLAHPHSRHHHPFAYAVGWIVLAGWVAGGVVMFPRLIDSVAYIAGAGGHATFNPTSYVQQYSGRAGHTVVTNGVLEIDGRSSAATWPLQVPLNAPFTVREPVWRWGLGSGLIDGDGSAVGSFFVCLLFDGAAVLALYIVLKPVVKRVRTGPPARPARRGH
jgi:hypothetical protein